MEKIPQEVYRRQRVMEYCRKHGNVSEAGRRYGYSRKTLYKWLKRWDGSKESLYDRSRAPHRRARGHSEKELRLVRRLAKKHKWQDIIVAYQEACQRYEYPYCYETFKRKVEEMRKRKPVKRKRRKNKPYQRAAYPGQKVQVSRSDVKEARNARERPSATLQGAPWRSGFTVAWLILCLRLMCYLCLTIQHS